jgi:hypothetical protein
MMLWLGPAIPLTPTSQTFHQRTGHLKLTIVQVVGKGSNGRQPTVSLGSGSLRPLPLARYSARPFGQCLYFSWDSGHM